MKKEFRGFAIIAVIFAVLYFTGTHTTVAAFAQRLVLHTGLISPDISAIINPEEADFNLELMDMEGNISRLSDHKGKLIFLNEWATWCPPCIAEMPSIQNLYNKVKGNPNIVFVMLSMDDTNDKPRKFIQKKKYTFPVYMASGRIPKVFRSRSIPTTFVISPEGKIISKKVGMAKYNSKRFINYIEKHALTEESATVIK